MGSVRWTWNEERGIRRDSTNRTRCCHIERAAARAAHRRHTVVMVPGGLRRRYRQSGFRRLLRDAAPARHCGRHGFGVCVVHVDGLGLEAPAVFGGLCRSVRWCGSVAARPGVCVVHVDMLGLGFLLDAALVRLCGSWWFRVSAWSTSAIRFRRLLPDVALARRRGRRPVLRYTKDRRRNCSRRRPDLVTDGIPDRVGRF